MRLNGYLVQMHRTNYGWVDVPFTQRSHQWCLGYLAAIKDRYPSDRFRVVKREGAFDHCIEEHPGNGPVHT